MPRHISAGPWLGIDEVQALLTRAARHRGQAAWAKRHGISQAYVNDVLHGRRLPGEKITKALGLEKALLWRTPHRGG